jgi:HAMP domain-containing protein
MNLLIRINLTLAAIFVAGGLATVLITRSALEETARTELISKANLMADSAMAMRTYTATEVSPLLDDRLNSEFLPQSVPFYAAAQSFVHLRAQNPDYAYKEATLNPTNPRDRATDWEADIIQKFRNDPKSLELVGQRDTPMGQSFYIARPIRVEESCLVCHSTPDAAPRSVVAKYGSTNGFGWQPNEVIGAQIVSVPAADAAQRARHVSGVLTTWLVVLFLFTLAAVDLVLYFLVVRPVRRVAAIADRLSLGEEAAPEFPTSGATEIVGLARSFNRMRTSLAKAMKLLEREP